MSARSNNTKKHYESLRVYFLYTLISIVIVCGLATVQFIYILELNLELKLYVMPFLVALVFSMLFARTKLLSADLKEMAIIDALTGLHNRRWFDERLASEIKISKRYKKHFSVIILDIDNFKAINDSFGHQAGDAVLIEVASIINVSCRKSDFTARWGGEEFIVLLPFSARDDAINCAEKIRGNMEKHIFKHEIEVTASFGVAQYNSEYKWNETVLRKADAALYRAKKSGRNRVEADLSSMEE